MDIDAFGGFPLVQYSSQFAGLNKNAKKNRCTLNKDVISK